LGGGGVIAAAALLYVARVGRGALKACGVAEGMPVWKLQTFFG